MTSQLSNRFQKILILDEGWPQTLPFLVALKSVGFDITLADPTVENSSILSPYRRKIQTPYPDDITYPLFIEKILIQEEFHLIIPTSERIMPVLWPMESKFSNRVYPLLNGEQQRAVTDRLVMYKIAALAGLTIPSLKVLGDKKDLEISISTLGFPLVLRGRQGLGGMQVKIVENTHEAYAAFEKLSLQSQGLPFAQEYILGDRYLIGGLCESGKVLSLFSQKTLEAFPKPINPSIRVLSFRDERLEYDFKSLIRALNWNGMACAEFIYHNKNYYFLEMNPRPWAAITAAKSCGIDLLEAYANFLAGRKIQFDKPFIADKEIILFPAFLVARSSKGHKHKLLIHPIQTFKCLAGGPWQEKYLMLYYLMSFFQWLKQSLKHKLIKLLAFSFQKKKI